MIDRIATGGMGVVWLARDERLQRPVAIKQLVLQPGLPATEAEDVRRRALREARIAARLQHPNAIMVFDVTEHDTQPCLVMEYLPSRSLAMTISERGPLPPAEVAAIGRQVAGALAAAHAAQIVHRDVKPGNILITDSGIAKITDFGISRAPGDATITKTGLLAGTPAYLAPEVARGHEPTPASDVFALGATLYAAVEGRGPFGTDDNQLALLHAAAAGRVAPPRHAGPLAPVLHRALAPEPDARPDMKQFQAALSEVLDAGARSGGAGAARTGAAAVPSAGAGDSATTGTPPARTSRRPSRYRGVPVKGGALVAAVVAVLTLGGFAAATMLEQTSAERVGAPPSPAPAPAGIPATAGNPPPSTRSSEPAEPPPQRAVPVDLSTGPIEWSAAGQLVIDYYAGAQDPSGAWNMLTPGAQSAFGGRAAFRDYWSQYSQVWAQNAYGVTVNDDGSVDVPVDVVYVTDSGERREHKVLRVTRQDGQLLIAEAAR